MQYRPEVTATVALRVASENRGMPLPEHWLQETGVDSAQHLGTRRATPPGLGGCREEAGTAPCGCRPTALTPATTHASCPPLEQRRTSR